MNFQRAIHRTRQGLVALHPRIPPERDEILAAALNPNQAAAFRKLSRFDQAHLCRVYDRLRAAGERNADLLTAGLLHDIGKVSDDGIVRLWHRVGRVLLGKYSPRLLAWLARPPATRWRAGWALAVHHPQYGAERARALGCSETTIWLIAHHEDRWPVDDPTLRRLIIADGCS